LVPEGGIHFAARVNLTTGGLDMPATAYVHAAERRQEAHAWVCDPAKRR
jgi:hypothetical protein